MTEMTEREMLEAQKRADAIVDKVRDLIALENQLLEARETAVVFARYRTDACCAFVA